MPVAVILLMSAGTASPVAATKLNAAPLPHEREAKQFTTSESETIIAHPSRFQRRPDYREVEAKKKKEEEEAAKKAEQSRLLAEQDRKRNQQEAIDNYKKRQELAIDANNKAVAAGKQGHWLEAIASHERAVTLDPQNKQFQINLSSARVAYGQAKLAAGDLTAAAGSFRKALAAAPDNGLAGKLLAQTMTKQGRDPVSADVRLATADQLAAIGDYEGASVEYQAAMQLEPSARTYTKMGDFALTFSQVGTATNWYRQAIVKDPDYGPAHRQLGLVLLSQKDYTSAAASLRKAVILDSHDTAAGQNLVEIWRKQVAANPLLAENHLGLAGALQLTGDFVGAESEYSRLEALDAKNPGLSSGRASLSRAIQHDKAEKHKLAAETLFNQGLRKEALSEISQSVMLEPRNARYQFMLGECLEANGDYQGAHQAYLTCVLIDPENNREAAARMKQMQGDSTGSGSISMRAQTAPPAAQPNYQQGMQPALCVSKKDIYESAQPATISGATPSLAPAGAEPVAAARKIPAGDPPAPPVESMPQAIMDPDLREADAKVSDAESKRDYAKAVTILQDLVTRHVQNPNVHHRLAVNLLNAGDINQAVSEFRVASALAPAKKDFADDLAQAMIIHKRTLTSEAASEKPAATAGATK